MLNWLRKAEPPAAADEMRALREAAGWSLEEAADALGVLPAEMAAWESGAMSDRREAALMRWRLECALYEARLPRPDCERVRASAARLAWMRGLDPRSAARAGRLEQAHARECGECARVQALLRQMDPPRPPAPAALGWMRAIGQRTARLPAWLRAPLEAVRLAAVLAGLYLAVEVMNRIQRDDTHVSPAQLAVVWAVIVWLTFVFRGVHPLFERRPYLAGNLAATGLAVPATLLLGMAGMDLSRASTWMAAGVVTAVVGCFTGMLVDESRRIVEAELHDPAWFDPPPVDAWKDEERAATIPQVARYWEP